MYRFSKVTEELRTSEIRDLMSLAIRPDIITFAGGMPGNDLFPIKEVDEIYNSLSENKKQIAFQYGPTPGYPPLLDSLKEFLRKKGLPVDENKLMITTGSLQAINILAKVFIDPGDEILTENPCFIGAISVFKSYSAKITGINIDEEGINIEQLKLELKKPIKPKFLYITPYFHNPAGIIYSETRKQQLIEAIKETDIPVIEDDAYGDLYFHDEDHQRVKPIKAINPEGVSVCYTGTFSKILGPGLRLGWMLVPDEIYVKAELCKQAFDACSPSFTQVIADEFIRSGAIYPYIQKLRIEYFKRARAMTDLLNKHLPAYVKWTEPRGGFYIWLNLPEGTDATEILKESLKQGAILVIGKTFDPEGKRNNAIRLAFSNTPIDKIEKGIPIVADAIKKVCG
jgi:DNA-binding transcriptional MocR family regulator